MEEINIEKDIILDFERIKEKIKALDLEKLDKNEIETLIKLVLNIEAELYSKYVKILK